VLDGLGFRRRFLHGCGRLGRGGRVLGARRGREFPDLPHDDGLRFRLLDRRGRDGLSYVQRLRRDLVGRFFDDRRFLHDDGARFLDDHDFARRGRLLLREVAVANLVGQLFRDRVGGHTDIYALTTDFLDETLRVLLEFFG
jgi:hypothetical protein